MLDTITQPLFTAVSKTVDLVRSAKSQSLAEYASYTRVEPRVLVEAEIADLPDMQNIMRTLAVIFSGYYLQSVMISLNVGNIDIIKQLERVNPNRKPIDSAGGALGSLLAMEAYANGLPDPLNPPSFSSLAMEASDDLDGDGATGAVTGKGTVETLQQANQLSVGKQLEIGFDSCGEKRTIVVNVRLMVQLATSKALNNILLLGSVDNSVKERFHRWRAGDLEMVKDLILCRDVISNHRRSLISDNTGYYAEARANNKMNKISAILSANPSIANYSSIIVISKETAMALERETGGKLSSYKVREKIFANIYAMIIAVVEPQWKTVTIYTHNTNRETTVPFSDMKNIGKGNGDEVSQVLEAYKLGDAPKF